MVNKKRASKSNIEHYILITRPIIIINYKTFPLSIKSANRREHMHDALDKLKSTLQQDGWKYRNCFDPSII